MCAQPSLPSWRHGAALTTSWPVSWSTYPADRERRGCGGERDAGTDSERAAHPVLERAGEGTTDPPGRDTVPDQPVAAWRWVIGDGQRERLGVAGDSPVR
jgi:hypothetical protein